MMSSTLCATTNVGEVNKIISNHGWIIKSFDKYIWKDKLNEIFEIYNDNDLWKQKEELAFNHINNNFNINIMVQNYIKFWKSCS